MIRFAILFLISLNAAALNFTGMESCRPHANEVYCLVSPATNSVEPVLTETRVSAIQTVAFDFDEPITVLPTAFALDATFNSIPIQSLTANGNQVIVQVLVPDQTTVFFSLHQVNNDISQAYGGHIFYLSGDLNGDGVVDQTDVNIIKSFSGQACDITNFWVDINANGAINSTDISAVKARVGRHL